MAPLVGSTNTSVLFVDPRQRHYSTLQDANQQGFVAAVKLFASATRAAAITPHIVSDDAALDLDDWPSKPDGAPAYYTHTFAKDGPTWTNSGLAAALATENKPNLVLCGFWLETKVSFLALCALSAGFDVYVAFDATPSQILRTREAALARLQQCGVVPTTTHQLLAEWVEESTDPTLRANLHALLPPT